MITITDSEFNYVYLWMLQKEAPVVLKVMKKEKDNIQACIHNKQYG